MSNVECRMSIFFTLATGAIDATRARARLAGPAAGAFVSFEGLVRDHSDGRAVRRLEYECYPALARKVGERIVRDALDRFDILDARCIHRIGRLEIGEVAVWIGVSAAHRREAFEACQFIIDEVKHRVPIWKKEHYADGDSGWVRCEACHARDQEGTHVH